MSNHNLRVGEKYYGLTTYSMKCRLYPNETEKKKIDSACHVCHVYYNDMIYHMKQESEDKSLKPEELKYTSLSDPYEGKVYHNANFKYMSSGACVKAFLENHPELKGKLPLAALEINNGLINKNLKMAMRHKAVWKKSETTGRNIKTHDKNVGQMPYSYEVSQPDYFTKKDPCSSFTIQVKGSKFTTKGNRNVLYVDMPKPFCVFKLRGWNQNIRFDPEGKTDFLAYVSGYGRDKQLVVTVSKESDDKYYMIVCISEKGEGRKPLVCVWNRFKEKPETSTGVDVGIKDIAILSDGTKYENKKFKANEEKHLKKLNRQLSRRWGWSNPKFREAQEKDKTIKPSKSYEETKLAKAKVEAKIKRKRENWNNQITSEIIANHGFIGIESLNVSGMMKNHHLSKALSDAAMYDILSKLAYKGEFYDRIVQPIGRYVPSSQRCHVCGYINREIKNLNIREWTCPECGTRHDRDVNAANSIDYYAHEAWNNNLHAQKKVKSVITRKKKTA